jgi:hypothetical protein
MNESYELVDFDMKPCYASAFMMLCIHYSGLFADFSLSPPFSSNASFGNNF